METPTVEQVTTDVSECSRLFVCTGVEYRVSQLADLRVADLCLSDVDGATEAPAMSSLFACCCGLCHLPRDPSVRVWIQAA